MLLLPFVLVAVVDGSNAFSSSSIPALVGGSSEDAEGTILSSLPPFAEAAGEMVEVADGVTVLWQVAALESTVMVAFASVASVFCVSPVCTTVVDDVLQKLPFEVPSKESLRRFLLALPLLPTEEAAIGLLMEAVARSLDFRLREASAGEADPLEFPPPALHDCV